MPLQSNALTVVQVRNAKPKSKPYRVFDGGGLHLEVSPTGAKYWRLKYRYAGKEKRLALGVFAEVSLTEAHESRDEARAQLRKDIDPGAARKATAQAARDAVANSFEAIACEWLEHQTKKLKATAHRKATALLETWAFPWIGRRPISEITPRELLESVLRRVEREGKYETAHRLKQRCGQIFAYASGRGKWELVEIPFRAFSSIFETPDDDEHSGNAS